MLGMAVPLVPAEQVACVVCGERSQQVIVTAAEVRAQMKFLHLFFRRRMAASQTERGDEDLADRAEFTQDYVTDVVACRGCGLVYRSPRPRASQVLRAYTEDHYGDERLRCQLETQSELYRPKLRVLRRLLADLDRTPRVVEVGSYAGGFLTVAGEQGWDALGVDPGHEVGDFCRRHGLNVKSATLDEARLPPRSVDCVAIWNCFDQLPNPHPTLAAAQRCLRPGGVLVVRVPSGACFRRVSASARRSGPRVAGWLRLAMAWNNLLGFPYLYGYSGKTLDRLLGGYGLRRVALVPDTLPRHSDGQMHRWARWEERLVKTGWRAAARVAPWPMVPAPWMDVYYRLA